MFAKVQYAYRVAMWLFCMQLVLLFFEGSCPCLLADASDDCHGSTANRSAQQLKHLARFACSTGSCPFQPLLSLIRLVQLMVQPAWAIWVNMVRGDSSVHSHELRQKQTSSAYPRIVETSKGEKALMQECVLQQDEERTLAHSSSSSFTAASFPVWRLEPACLLLWM